MTILGFDPGTATMGYAAIEKDGNRFRALDYGALITPKEMPAPERLLKLREGILELLDHYQPDVVVTEQLFFSANQKTAVQVARAIGVVLLSIAERDLPWHEYSPMQVKQAVTGYGGAEKKQVQLMVQRLLSLSSIPKPDDAADALALCICHANHSGIRQMLKP